MQTKTRAWFKGLSSAAKIGTVSTAFIALMGGAAAVDANRCSDAISYASETNSESVAFGITEAKDPSMNIGETKTTKPGVEGKNLVSYKIGSKCGKQISKAATKTVIKSAPVSQEQLVGSKEVATETQEVEVSFDSQNINDSAMDKGTNKVTQNGSNGKKTITFSVVKVDGQEQSRTQTAETVTLAPVSQITRTGTKVASNCDPNYTPCIPYYAGDALNCRQVGISVRVIGVDHNRLDGDGDTYGCESY